MSRVFILQGPLRDSFVTAGGRWSDRAKAAYKSWRDYIIAVKGKMRHRVNLSTQSESAAFRRTSLISLSGDLWCGVVHDGVKFVAICPHSAR